MIIAYKDLQSLESRYKLLDRLSDDVVEKFGDNYYMSVFGSFIREDFIPGKSDIDIGLYCEDPVMHIELRCFLEDWLQKHTDLDFDIITISLTPYCWIYLSILTDGVCLTDYFPDFLKSYRGILRKQYREWYPRYRRHLVIEQNRRTPNIIIKTE